MQVPNVIEGGSHTDSRGTIRFVNDFVLDKVKRFYLIEHPEIEIARAWQGHKVEQKWFYVIEGGFKVAVVKPDNWERPSESLPVMEFELIAKSNQILHVPAGYANGFRALSPGSKLMVYSSIRIQDAPADDFRFPQDYWYDWKNLKAL